MREKTALFLLYTHSERSFHYNARVITREGRVATPREGRRVYIVYVMNMHKAGTDLLQMSL